MAPLMIAGTALQAVSTIASGRQAAEVGSRNAAVLNEQARQTDIATAGRENLLRERSGETLSAQRAAMRQNGIDPATGSGLFASAQAMRDADLDALQLRYEGLMQSRAERMAAQNELWRGKAARRQSYFSAAGQLVQGGGNYLSLTKAPGGAPKSPLPGGVGAHPY
jgi:hypothetical protein